MSALINLLAKGSAGHKQHSVIARVHNRFARLGEIFWFCLALLLFVLLGPFSIIAVIIGLFSLAGTKENRQAVKPASINV